MSELYDLLLIAHSFMRWWVLVACVAAASYAVGTTGSRTPATQARDLRIGRGWVLSVDVQVLLGMSLYFAFSPLPRAARQLWATRGWLALWADPLLRFFGLIHPALALSAAFVTHAAWVAVRRAESSRARRRWLGLGAALALAILLAAVPWPVLGHERPWFRF